MSRGNSRGAKGAGHRVGIDMGQLATEEPDDLGGRRRPSTVARAVWPETVKHGSVRGSGRNSPGLLGNRKQDQAKPDWGWCGESCSN